ncbi:hypothetical protein AMTR_s00017p00246790 [Amborella trichopoda]|uniref:Uncharacterized protein n=1 Tax=Amborella trichopoda TaxID=13333 RepID=W1PNL8_AMBTC|nr:hypothetical protein AMTR_s00017p00246790 [Amborella trichopoda]
MRNLDSHKTRHAFPFSSPPISSTNPASLEPPLNRAPPPPSFNGIPLQNPQFICPNSVLSRPPIMALYQIHTSFATVSEPSFHGNHELEVFGQDPQFVSLVSGFNRPLPVAPFRLLHHLLQV